MKYKITEASRDKWLAVAKDCPYATYFHTPYWYDIIAPNQNHQTIEVTFTDGASAVIPIAQIKRAGGLLVDNFSSPGGTYGGWISASPLSEDRIKILADILTSMKNLTYRINPIDKSSSSLIPSYIGGRSQTAPTCFRSGVSIKNDFTHTLDLTAGERPILSGMSKGHRSAITAAERGGVTVKPAETREEWDQYYDMYMDSVDRWRGNDLSPRTVYPRALFRRIFENRTDNEILWLALIDGVPAAGGLFFYWGRHAVSWHGAASAQHFNLRPVNLLYWEIIKNAIAKGYEIFDFNPSGGYEGVERFKDHFGAARVSTPVLTTRTGFRSVIGRRMK